MKKALLLIAFLAGCSGGSGGGSTDDPIDDLPDVIDPGTDLGPTGTATYRGPLSLDFVPNQSVAVNLSGTLALSVDFDSRASGGVTGNASGFETASGGSVDGTLYLSEGALDDEDTALLLESQIAGSLRSGTDSYLIFGQMAGEVLGTDQGAITGTISGTARESGADASLSGDFQVGQLP